jgi:hypothetical protein
MRQQATVLELVSKAVQSPILPTSFDLEEAVPVERRDETVAALRTLRSLYQAAGSEQGDA